MSEIKEVETKKEEITSNNQVSELLPPDNKLPNSEAKEEIKKPSEMKYEELVKYLANKKIYRFLIINEDGTYNYIEKIRKSLSNKQRDNIESLRIIGLNFRNLLGQRIKNDDEKSIYFNNSYYLWSDGKTQFYTQNDVFTFYFKTVIHYAFNIPYEDMKYFAYDDDPEEMDKNDSFCFVTIARTINEIGNLGLSFFR